MHADSLEVKFWNEKFSKADQETVYDLVSVCRAKKPPKQSKKTAPISHSVEESCKVHTNAEADDVSFVAEGTLLAGHSMLPTAQLQQLMKDAAFARSVKKQRRRSKRGAKSKSINLSPQGQG